MVVHMERAEELEVLESIEDGLEFLSRSGVSHINPLGQGYNPMDIADDILYALPLAVVYSMFSSDDV
jgi:hypothetical protein